MKAPLLFLLIFSAVLPPTAWPQAVSWSSPVVVVDFTNPSISPSHWVITLHSDGSGHFHSDRGESPSNEAKEIDVPFIDRDIQVSPSFAAHVFQTAQQHHWFNEECESHLKVAFQGWKTKFVTILIVQSILRCSRATSSLGSRVVFENPM
jgi:hypothetical protein